MRILLRGKGIPNIVNRKKTVFNLDDPVLLSNFEKCRDFAPTDILLSMETFCTYSVITLHDPSEAWTKLETIYRGVADAFINTCVMHMHKFYMRLDE